MNDEQQPNAPSSTVPIPLGRGSTGKASGKFWKDDKTAFKRSHLSSSVKTKSHSKQVEAMNREKAVRKLLKEMKEESENAEKERKQKIVERRKAKEEAARLEAMKAKMGARRTERMKRKAGRTKKINH